MKQPNPKGLFAMVELNYQCVSTYGKIYVYVDHVSDGIEWWFNDEHNPYDDNDSCVDGVKNGENIDNLRDVKVENDEDAIIMNKIAKDLFLSKLCVEGVEEEENNIEDDDKGM
ncbi:unnamed protein product [Lactuca saligna]|uniref:Uncharacterized protein n=1 Tax=Lactuca saligna TaxID=75948 RepID=A0AA35V0S6_LACSI|nr:unnamed protein product [Lactuca saligna]